MNLHYLFAVVGTALLAISMIAGLHSSISLSRKSKIGFAFMFLILAIVNLSEMGAAIIDKEKYKIEFYVLKSLELALIPMIAFTGVFAISEGKKDNILLSLSVITPLLLVISSFTGIIFKVNGGEYIRGPLYFILVVFQMLSYGILIYRCSKLNLLYQINNIHLLSMSAVMVLIGILMPLTPLTKNIRLDWAFVTMGVVLFYEFYTQLLNQTDELTKLSNRKCYDNYYRGLNRKVAIIYFDVDNFKEVNEMHGHLYGDECLYKTAHVIKNALGKHSKSFRIGGDDFVSFVPLELFNKDKFEEKLQDLTEIEIKEDSRFAKASYGIVYYDPEHDSYIEKMAQADHELYKNQRKNGVA